MKVFSLVQVLRFVSPYLSCSFRVGLSIAGFVLAKGAEYTPEPALAIVVDRPILVFDGKKGGSVQTKLSVHPLNFPPGSDLVYQWRQVQDEMSPTAAKMAGNPISFTATDKQEITAAFPGKGVYEVRLTVSDIRHQLSVSRNTWVNVWDSRPAITVDGKPDPLTAVPGMLPPPRVRNLAPDPGPFIHPRMLATPSDWGDINDRCVEGQSKLASNAWKMLARTYGNGIDPKSRTGVLLNQLVDYANSDFKGTPPLGTAAAT